VEFGLAIRHSLQFIEHGGYIPRHADLIGLGAVTVTDRHQPGLPGL
jgi:hypothetical protein